MQLVTQKTFVRPYVWAHRDGGTCRVGIVCWSQRNPLTHTRRHLLPCMASEIAVCNWSLGIVLRKPVRTRYNALHAPQAHHHLSPCLMDFAGLPTPHVPLAEDEQHPQHHQQLEVVCSSCHQPWCFRCHGPLHPGAPCDHKASYVHIVVSYGLPDKAFLRMLAALLAS